MEENNFTIKPDKYKGLIKCPHCGAEYLLEEIFMSEDIIGSRHAIKDEKGRIVFVEGEEPDMSSEYICDYCDKKFTITMDTKMWTGVVEDLWDEEYSVEIFKDRITLDE